MIKNIEKIKTIVLWFLVISSIALVVIRYNLISFDQISGETRFYNDNIYENIVMPKHISIKFGQYDMTEILFDKDIYYNEVKQIIATVLRQNDGIKKIEKIQYDDLKQYDNILLEYNKIPSLYIEKSVKLKKTLMSDLGFIQEIYLKSDEG